MNSPTSIPQSFDLLDSKGQVTWASLALLTLLLVCVGTLWPIYPVADNPALESLLQSEDSLDSTRQLPWLRPTDQNQRLPFDIQALLYVHQIRGTRAISTHNLSPQEWVRTLMLISKYTTDLAKGEVVLALMLLAALWAKLKRFSDEVQMKINSGFAGMVVGAILTWVIKIGVGRARPNGLFYQGDMDWSPVSLENLHHSFPSGHSTAAGAMMMLLIFHFPRFRFLWFGAALWICATRVLTANHWPTDTLAGLLVGAFSVAWLSSVTRSRMKARVQEPA